jgi:hypothetical protein
MPLRQHVRSRRRVLGWLAACALPLPGCRRTEDPSAAPPGAGMLTVYTFGDSILDCGRYNAHGVHPGQLLVRNDDRLFPEFKRVDLRSRRAARLVHRAVDGATIDGLPARAAGLESATDAVALVTVGGNDLLRGLAADDGGGVRAFARALAYFCERLPVRPILLGTVYDPTFGDDRRNFLPVDARIARANHVRVNAAIRELGERHGGVADLHGHFLTGTPAWYTNTIEPSLLGASEVRRVFWSLLDSHGLTAPRPPS